MSRAERRRQQKTAAKSQIPAPLNVRNFTLKQISEATGVRTEILKEHLETKEKEIRLAVIRESQEKLCRAEDYLAAANVLISLFAIKMTWGFTKANHKFLENLNPAMHYVNRIGVDEAYEQLKKEMGIRLEFDSMDINKEFGFGEYDD